MGAAIVPASHSLVQVAVGVEVLNALLLPIVIGFLVVLARTTLPRPHRLRVVERVAIVAVVAVATITGLGWAGLTVL